MKAHRTNDPPTNQVNSVPGSAATTCDRVLHERPACSLWPANHAPTTGPSAPSTHSHDLHTGLHSPVRSIEVTRS